MPTFGKVRAGEKKNRSQDPPSYTTHTRARAHTHKVFRQGISAELREFFSRNLHYGKLEVMCMHISCNI
jgi:hypothetical protein